MYVIMHIYKYTHAHIYIYMFPCAACHGISPRPHSIVYQAVLIVLFSFKQKVCKAVVAKKGAHSGFWLLLGSRLKHVTDNLVARLRRRDCGFRARITVTKDYVVFSSSLFERLRRAGPVWQQIPPTPLRILTTFFLSARGSPGRDKKKIIPLNTL